MTHFHNIIISLFNKNNLSFNLFPFFFFSFLFITQTLSHFKCWTTNKHSNNSTPTGDVPSNTQNNSEINHFKLWNNSCGGFFLSLSSNSNKLWTTTWNLFYSLVIDETIKTIWNLGTDITKSTLLNLLQHMNKWIFQLDDDELSNNENKLGINTEI